MLKFITAFATAFLLPQVLFSQIESNVGTATAEKPLRALLICGGCCHDYTEQHKVLSDGIQTRAPRRRASPVCRLARISRINPPGSASCSSSSVRMGSTSRYCALHFGSGARPMVVLVVVVSPPPVAFCSLISSFSPG